MDQNKREQREAKREIKRAGTQRRRRVWKRELRENPEDAPYSGEDFGRYSTAGLNGIDKDATRRRDRNRQVLRSSEPQNRPAPVHDLGTSDFDKS